MEKVSDFYEDRPNFSLHFNANNSHLTDSFQNPLVFRNEYLLKLGTTYLHEMFENSCSSLVAWTLAKKFAVKS